MYIPTTFFGTQGATILSSGSLESGIAYYNGYFVSNSVSWAYHYWGGDEGGEASAADNITTNGSLTIFSGSTTQANVYIIAGGGGSGKTHAIYSNGLGGGGAGGVVRYNNFPLVPGTYGIVAGAGGDVGTLGDPPGPVTSGTPPYAAAGLAGINSYIQLANSGTYTPFTSSIILAYGGSGGGAASGNGTNQSYVTASNSIPGASNGGNAQTVSGNGANTPTSSLGIGFGGLNGLNQGNLGGGIGAYAPQPSRLKGCSAGGGGAMSRSLDITPIDTSPYYSAPVTNGGDGIQLKIYPLNNGTASYYAGGGNATNSTLRTSSSFGLGGEVTPATYDIGAGGNNSCTPVGQNFNVSYTAGAPGGVYIEYPYIPYTPQPILSTNGLTLYNAINSFSSSIWYDVSGNGNNALVSGTIYKDTNTNGYLFDGFTNYLTYSSSLVATPSSSMTLQWYGTYYPSGSNRFLFTKNDYLDGWDTIFTTTNNIDFRDVGDRSLATNYTYPERTLYTLLINNGYSKLYKNAEIAPPIAEGGNAFNGFTTSSQSLRFGYPVDGDATYFKGAISSLLIYNRLLYPQEIANNYAYLSASAYSYVNPIQPLRSASIDYLVVAGGGGNGYSYSGGGGAGGVITGSTIIYSSTNTITIGLGGSGSTGGSIGTNGQNSSLVGSYISQSAIGGGKGARFNGVNACVSANGGGSGGGGNASQNYGNGTRGAGTAGQGFAGAAVTYNTFNGGGGGGGAAAEGVGYNGGNGIQWLDTNYYGGGGNGITITGNYGTGGIGGGGASGSAGTPNTGGGGGGKLTGGVFGGSGVVIIRYPGTGSIASGGTITYNAGYTYHTFNSSSTFVL